MPSHSFFPSFIVRSFFFAVPSAAPKVLSLSANKTAIDVSWAPIPRKDVNGILRGYYVIYWKRPRKSPDNHVIQVNQSTLRVIITGLERNSTYGLRLAGLTKVRGYLRNGALSPTYNVTTKYGKGRKLLDRRLPVR